MEIWQTIDKDSEKATWFKTKPVLLTKGNGYDGYDYTDGFLFDIPLKPLQIAEITVNENGTWSYEIEREDGLYICKNKDGDCFLVKYQNGVWYYKNSHNIVDSPEIRTFSTARIPDECII